MSDVVRGHRRPTMVDVATKAGVSHQTVSRVLNDFGGIRPETRGRVLDAIEELGYRRNDAARRLASARSGLLGVVTSALPQYGPASILVGLETASRAAGYQLTTANVVDVSTRNFMVAVDQLLEQAVEALVLVVPHLDILRIVPDLGAAIPVVVVEGDLSTTPLTAGVDNLEGARAATAHLLDLGHSTVVHVAGPAGWAESAARIEGWRTELVSRGSVVPPLRWAGDWSARSGFIVGETLAREPDVTAVFAANDQMALGIVRALVSNGRRVPEDVSVVGFDDLPEAAYFNPPLTTVRQPFAKLALNVVELVTRALDGQESPRVALVKTELIIRSTTCLAPT